MITKTALLKKTPVLFANTADQVYAEFQYYDSKDNAKLPKHLKLLYADYTYEDYSGDAYVLGYNKEKKQFFEVHGSHCSCYGLEDQWDEEYYDDWKTLSICIRKRLDTGAEWYSRYANSSSELKAFLEVSE